tara:strand:+ start:8882 stop:9253 length:372 start_codon:yes stop_codon:yes gene_type:complete
MLKELYTILISGLVFLILDSIYLGITSKLFHEIVAGIQRTVMVVKPMGVIVCYIFLILGLYYFILRNKKTPVDAFLLGILIYGVYESTNYAIFKKWPDYVTILDTVWGGTLFASTTIITYSII